MDYGWNAGGCCTICTFQFLFCVHDAGNRWTAKKARHGVVQYCSFEQTSSHRINSNYKAKEKPAHNENFAKQKSMGFIVWSEFMCTYVCMCVRLCNKCHHYLKCRLNREDENNRVAWNTAETILRQQHFTVAAWISRILIFIISVPCQFQPDPTQN